MRAFLSFKTGSCLVVLTAFAGPAAFAENAGPAASGTSTPVAGIFLGTVPSPTMSENCVGREAAWSTGIRQSLDGMHWRMPYPRTAKNPNPNEAQHAELAYCSEYTGAALPDPAQARERQLNYRCCDLAFKSIELRVRGAVDRNEQLELPADARECVNDWLKGKRVALECLSSQNQVCNEVDFSRIRYPGCFSHGFWGNYSRTRLEARRLQQESITVNDSSESSGVQSTDGFWFGEEGASAPGAE